MDINKNTQVAVGENVRRFREAKQISIPEAASAIGVHRSWWNLLEGGTLNFTIEKLEKVAEFLGVPVRKLFTEPVTVFAQDEAPHDRKPKRRKSA